MELIFKKALFPTKMINFSEFILYNNDVQNFVHLPDTKCKQKKRERTFVRCVHSVSLQQTKNNQAKKNNKGFEL